MKIYRIFLASSYKLQEERTALVAEINRLNDKFAKKHVHLELVIWEKLDAGNDPLRKQNYYNEQLKNCDILIFAYWGQLGIFTKEEYQLAQNLFVDNGLPKIYTFKKTIPVDFILNKENVEHLKALEKILYEKDKEQWPWEYENAEGFIHKFTIDLEARFNDPSDTYFIFPDLPKAKLLSPNGAANPNVFIGNEEELNDIRKRLDNCGKLMLINAEGGIGKTTLAAKYWNESLYDYKHNAWLFCENGIVNALKELAPKLYIDLAGMDETQQLNALKHALSGVHDDFLLVLDNANDDEDIRVFRQTFEGFHWHVLITSRCQGVLDKEQEMSITHLPPPLAKVLFERYYKEEGTDFDAFLDGLLKKISYHTLSVELFAKSLKELAERGETMKHFVEKLEKEGIFLGKRAKNIKTDYTSHSRIEGNNSDEILANFYNFTNLAKDEKLRYYLVNMALLPAEEYDFLFLCELFEQDSLEFDALHKLATKGWLGKNGKMFKINPIIQEIALRKNEDSLELDFLKLIIKTNLILANDGENFIENNSINKYIYSNFLKIRISEKYADIEHANYCFNLGLYYRKKNDFENAIKSYNKYCLYAEHFLKIKKYSNKLILAIFASSKFLIGLSKILNKEEKVGVKLFEESLTEYLELIKSEPSFGNFYQVSIILINISQYYARKKEYKIALKNIILAKEYLEIVLNEFPENFNLTNKSILLDLNFCQILLDIEKYKEFVQVYYPLRKNINFIENIFFDLEIKILYLQYLYSTNSGRNNKEIENCHIDIVNIISSTFDLDNIDPNNFSTFYQYLFKIIFSDKKFEVSNSILTELINKISFKTPSSEFNLFILSLLKLKQNEMCLPKIG